MAPPATCRKGGALGWAFLILALAGISDALSIMRDDGPQGIMFTFHHKTGKNLGQKIEACFVDEANIAKNLSAPAKRCKEQRTKEDLEWNGKAPSDCSRVVHMVRAPREIARSAYLYHKQQPPVEAWLNETVQEVVGEMVPGTQADESYNHFLSRIPMSVGVFAEMKGFSGRIVHDIEYTLSISKEDKRVLLVCLEDFWADFDGTMQKVADHLNLPFSEGVRSCVESVNPNKHPYGMGMRKTNGTLTESEMAKLRGLIQHHDEKWLKGWFGASPLATICKASDDYSTARHSVDATEWLDQNA